MTAWGTTDTGELEQLQLIVERLPIGVIVFDKKRYDITFANNAARRMVRPAKARRGTEMPDPWPSFSLPEYAARLVSAGFAPDTRVDVDEERIYLVSGIATPTSSESVILFEDISARDRRSRAEREFVANAAHELLSPLTGITSAAHVLQAGAKEVREDRDRFIAHIVQECERLTRVARSLLVLARAQSGEEPPRLEISPLCELLDEVVEHVPASINVDCDKSLTVFTDADLLVQALHNLVTNAATHGQGDEVLVTAKRRGDKVIAIDVCDSGGAPLGVSEFRGRFRSGAGRDGGGFGLGLSIAEQSLEVIGGRLTFVDGAARVEVPQGSLAR